MNTILNPTPGISPPCPPDLNYNNFYCKVTGKRKHNRANGFTTVPNIIKVYILLTPNLKLIKYFPNIRIS